MGSRSDNGGGWPPDGGTPDGLPELPPEWRDIVIPDDLSSLADEVAAVRAELDTRHRTPWQQFVRRPGVRRLRRLSRVALRVPVLIVAIAILVTVASLFASGWTQPPRPTGTQRTPDTTDDALDTLPALELVGADSKTVPLRGRLPAVILLIDNCDCARLVADTATAVPAGTTVVTVVTGAGTSRPAPPTAAAPPATRLPVQALRDPTGELRSAFHFGPADGTAAALVVDRAGGVIRRVPRTASVEAFRPDLARL